MKLGLEYTSYILKVMCCAIDWFSSRDFSSTLLSHHSSAAAAKKRELKYSNVCPHHDLVPTAVYTQIHAAYGQISSSTGLLDLTFGTGHHFFE